MTASWLDEQVRSAGSNNLPTQLTSFIGRRAELAELKELVATTRLLSVTGAGGCGKTRLALQLSAEVVDAVPGGVWLVELARLIDPDRVLSTIASTLGERELQGDLVEAIAIRVAEDPTVVVLDNCEHLLDAVATVVDALLRRCDALTIVATSREPLGVPGETAWRVPSMPAPAPNAEATITDFDAVQLFLDRAAKARPNFALTSGNAAAIAQICHRLDGIPLAVELAAARVRSLTVQQVAAGLDDRFRLLTGGARTVLPRQQTLQASVDWSYDLLSERERALFRRLSVFAGGFTLDAAEQVGAGGDIEAVEVLDLLLALVDKSMIECDESSDRYRMLESMRQYSSSRLVDAGETASVRDAHLAWAASLFTPLDVLDRDPLQVADEHAAEVDNLRAAFEWSVSSGDANAAAAFVVALAPHEMWRGDPRAAALNARRALDVPGASPASRCMTLVELAFATAESAERDAVECAIDEFLEIVRTVDDETRAVCLQWAAQALLIYGEGFPHAMDLLAEAIETARAAGRQNTEGMSSALLALMHFVAGDWRRGEALAAIVERGPASSFTVANLSAGRQYSLYMRGRYDEARRLVDEIPLVTPRFLASVELSRLQLDMAQGVDSGAAARLESRLADARRRGFTSSVGMLGWGPGALRMSQGDGAQGAAELVAWFEAAPSPWGTFVIAAYLTLGRLDAARAEIEYERDATWGGEAAAMRRTFETVLFRLEGDLPAAEQCGHEALRAHYDMNCRPQFAHALEALAGIAAAVGSYVESARLAGAAHALRDEMGHRLRWPFEVQLQTADVAAARAAIGDDAYDAAFAEGRTLDDDAVLAYVQRARGERKRPTAGWESLTPTELEVVRRAAAGLSNKEIGAELLMGAETVKTHLSHVYDKVGVRSRAALASAYAARAGAGRAN